MGLLPVRFAKPIEIIAFDFTLSAHQGTHPRVNSSHVLGQLNHLVLQTDAPSSLTTGVRLTAFFRAAVRRCTLARAVWAFVLPWQQMELGHGVLLFE